MSTLQSSQSLAEIDESLDHYLEVWDKQYIERTKKIDLFNTDLTSKWSLKQKQLFVKIFYHARGHFHEFLWYMGNHADSKHTKDMVIQNIAEELNGSASSHEQMYFDFATSLDVDMGEEFISEEHYLPFVKKFNKGHIKWLHEHNNNARSSAFAAYERLDNVDYISLLSLAESLGVTRKGLNFFKVHVKVKHFETVEGQLREIWATDQEQAKTAFDFIADHQMQMWQGLSDVIFAAQ